MATQALRGADDQPKTTKEARRLPFAPMWTGQLGVAVATGLLLVLAMFFLEIESDAGQVRRLGSNTNGLLDIFIVSIGPLLGYIIGFARVHISDREAVSGDNITQSQIDNLSNGSNTKEGSFLTISSALICFYILGYYASIWKFADGMADTDWPVNPVIAGVTSVTLGFLGFFLVKYSAFVRTTKLLETAVATLPRAHPLVERLRNSVFRGEQLYEPPGNIFVTVGITATFLGLAAALVNLDLHELLRTAPNRNAAAGALSSFVGCMGLALGVSMLGVMTSVAAQWLRGHGSMIPTDELLGRASRPPRPPRKPPEGSSTTGAGTQALRASRPPAASKGPRPSTRKPKGPSGTGRE
jgi:hypothetical protein